VLAPVLPHRVTEQARVGELVEVAPRVQFGQPGGDTGELDAEVGSRHRGEPAEHRPRGRGKPSTGRLERRPHPQVADGQRTQPNPFVPPAAPSGAPPTPLAPGDPLGTHDRGEQDASANAS
jgi:hypothetical protein